jgi:hypothetical protein
MVAPEERWEDMDNVSAPISTTSKASLRAGNHAHIRAQRRDNDPGMRPVATHHLG